MSNEKFYIGVDVGSITVKVVAINEKGEIVFSIYERSNGDPINRLRKNLNDLDRKIKKNIYGIGVTGSGRNLANLYIGADLIIDEITAQSVAVSHFYPQANSIIEIGGQDSKMIIMENGVVKDFAMNTICAAGTGAFLDQQAGRLNIKIKNFGKIALAAKRPTKIAGRCTVFAETDMIHKQQIGIPVEDILAGLCESLAKNFFHAVAKNIKIKPPVIFQGGVAANEGMVAAFNKLLGTQIVIPDFFKVMPALGSALLVLEKKPTKSNFKGLKKINAKIRQVVKTCKDCSNNCELIEIFADDDLISIIGSVCGKY